MAAMDADPPPPPDHGKEGWQKYWSDNGSRPCRKCRQAGRNGQYFWKVGCTHPDCVAYLQM